MKTTTKNRRSQPQPSSAAASEMEQPVFSRITATTQTGETIQYRVLDWKTEWTALHAVVAAPYIKELIGTGFIEKMVVQESILESVTLLFEHGDALMNLITLFYTPVGARQPFYDVQDAKSYIEAHKQHFYGLKQEQIVAVIWDFFISALNVLADVFQTSLGAKNKPTT